MKVREIRTLIADWHDDMDVVFATTTILAVAEPPAIAVPGRAPEVILQPVGLAQVVTTIQSPTRNKQKPPQSPFTGRN